MKSEAGNSNRITREYLDSLLIETRYMDAGIPDMTYTLFGESFRTPVMVAVLSHLNHFMFEGASDMLARASAAAGAIQWIGMAEEKEIERCAELGSRLIEIIKPYQDREKIYRKIRHAESCGLLAVGVDIDHAFGGDGSLDVVDGETMAPLTTDELTEIRASTHLPFIVKGVLSKYDADRCAAAGADGLVLSHHNNRIEFAVPPLMALPEIRKAQPGIKLFVDCEISSGMDGFKTLALGADGFCVGRPLMTAIKENGEEGAKTYLEKIDKELRKAMAFTGTSDLQSFDSSVIRHKDF